MQDCRILGTPVRHVVAFSSKEFDDRHGILVQGYVRFDLLDDKPFIF